MKSNKKLLCVLLSIIFLTIPLGIAAFTPIESTTTLADTSALAEDYDFSNRREPINILVYNQYSDNTGAGEWDHTMGELNSEYDYKFEYDNLTDYTELETQIGNYDVLLLIEQELATFAEMDTIAAYWSGFIEAWVLEGGVVICMDHWSIPTADHGVTARILNGTGLMSIYNYTSRTGDAVTITDSFDPLAYNAGAFTGPSGSSSFDITNGNEVFGCSGQTAVAHRYLGLGHVVMLGFDMFAINPNQAIILANAVRLTRLAVFDNSHSQYFDSYSGYNDFATEIQTEYGFAIATMNTWNPALVETCQVLVTGNNLLVMNPYNVSEVNFIKGFVDGGGGLLVTTDIWNYGNNTDTVLEGFGFERDYALSFADDSDDNEGNPSQPVYGLDNIANHSATIGVNSIQMMGSTAFTIIPEDAKSLIWTDSDGTANWSIGGDASGLTLVASLNYGAGRVIAIADGDFLSDTNNDGDGTSDFYDLNNEELASSVMIWLSAAGIPEKTILFDQSHSPIWTVSGQLFECTRFLSFNGFNVRWANHFSEALIAESDVLAIVDGSTNHTASEIATIVDFVAQGGGLFIMGDWGIFGSEVAPIGLEFGLVYNTTGYIVETGEDLLLGDSYNVYEGANIGTHPIMTGVSRIEIDRGGGFVSVGSGTVLVSTDDDGTATWFGGGNASEVALMAATEYNMGRVVYTSDINLYDFSDADGDGASTLYDSDNDVFTANAFYWLIENRAPTVDVITPNGGELLNGTITIEWDAVDFDSDPLTYDVFYSDNNGSDWSILANDLAVLEFAWNTTLHVDGTGYMIRVEVSDGVLVDQDESDNPFELDNFDETTTGSGIPIDPTLLAIIGAAVLVFVIVIVIIMKKKKK